MANNDVVRISGEPVPRLEEGMRVDSDSDSESGSISISNPSSNSSSSSDASAHPDSDSDGDSATSEVSDVELDPFAGSRLVRVNEGDEQDQFVKNRFLSVMSGLGLRTAVETVYKNVYPDFTWQAKLRSFLEISRNMEKTGEGLGKVTYAWFGGSKHEIDNIFRSGFASRGRGICLSPFNSPLASLRGCVADENGLYHLILCRAILGKSELVPPSAQQRFPSSEEFHSGVDNLASPRVYMVWSSYMNTHVMPQYVVSFRPPLNAQGGVSSFGPPVPENPVRALERAVVAEFKEAAARGEPIRMIPFPKLILELAKELPTSSIRLLQKGFSDYREGKVTKQELKQKLRELARGDVLYRAVMSIRRRDGASEEAAPGDSNNAVPAQTKSGARSSANKVIKKLRGERSA